MARMNTVVFAVHACPVGALGPYGNEWVATPTLDRLAAEGVVFDRHLSDCPDPTAARRAWLTGTPQTPRRDGQPLPDAGGPGLLARLTAAGVVTVLVDHTRPGNGPPAEFYAGFRERFAAPPSAADTSPVAALLRVLPQVAAAVRDGPYLIRIELDRLVPPWDVPQGVFDAYIEDVFDTTPDDPASRESTLDAEAVLTADQDIEVIDPTAGEYFEEVEVEDEPAEVRPVAASIAPWADPPAGWFDRADAASWELLHRSFAAAVTQFDADLGRLFAALRDEGLADAAWVVTADRGQALGEHGLIGPGRPWLHEELVHVPLMVRLPEGKMAGRRTAELTTPADVMPTLLELHGLPADGVPGVSLAPYLGGAPAPSRPAVVSGLVLADASEWAVRTAAWAYLAPDRVPEDDDPREAMLFVKPDDRFEMNDVTNEHVEAAAGLEAVLTAAVGEATSPPGPLSEAEKGGRTGPLS